MHRDVSPQNVLCGFDGAARVTDFGIAKALDRATKTSVGVVKGSGGYMSPEQLRFDEPDRRSDLFSLGVVLYELLAGQPLYAATPGPEAARRILTETPPDIGDVRDDVPDALADLVFRLLAKDRAQRPASAAEVAQSLEAALVEVLHSETRLDTAEYVQRRFDHLRVTRRPEVIAVLEREEAPPPSPSPPPARTRWRHLPMGLAVIAAAGMAGAYHLGRTARRQAPATPAAPVAPAAAPRPPTGEMRINAVWTGGWHTCVPQPDGLYCWGKNNEGQLGSGWTLDQQRASRVNPVIPDPVDADGGAYHTCVATAKKNVLCFGRNSEGQLGTGNRRDSLVPVAVASDARFTDLDAGEQHTCAVTDGGQVLCWGDNRAGQLGDGTTTARFVPTPVAGVRGAEEVKAGGNTTCARVRGKILCWGDLSLELPGGPAVQPTAREVSGVDDAAELGVGGALICARRRTGRVACWGKNDRGQLGDGTTESRAQPRDIEELEAVSAISVGQFHGCAIRGAGQLLCWGRNQWGNVGNGSNDDVRRPAPVPGLNDALSVSAGRVHTCARSKWLGLMCWGHNETGQLGDGTKGKNRPRPVTVIGLH